MLTSFTPKASLTLHTRAAPPKATIPVAIANAFAANIPVDMFTRETADIMSPTDALSESEEKNLSGERETTDEEGKEGR